MSLEDSMAKELFQRKAKVLEKVFSTRCDRIDLAQSCQNFYTQFLHLEAPKVLIADGPTEGISYLNHVRGKKSYPPLESSFSFSPSIDPTSLAKSIPPKVYQMAKQAKEVIKSHLGDEPYRESCNFFLHDLNYQLCQSFFYPLMQGIYKKFRTELSHFEFSQYPSFGDSDWVYFNLSLGATFKLNSLIPKEYFDFINQGLFAAFLFEEVAVLIPNPSHVFKNDDLVLHDEDKPAVQWKDGTSFCYWNGIEIPEKLICDQDTVTANDILAETNAEVRRCYQEILGSKKFGSLLGLIVLDKKVDRFGNELILYQTKERDRLVGGYIYFAQVACPSTKRIYFLCVPPGFNTVEEAVSWTFGKTPDEYNPIIET